MRLEIKNFKCTHLDRKSLNLASELRFVMVVQNSGIYRKDRHDSFKLKFVECK